MDDDLIARVQSAENLGKTSTTLPDLDPLQPCRKVIKPFAESDKT